MKTKIKKLILKFLGLDEFMVAIDKKVDGNYFDLDNRISFLKSSTEESIIGFEEDIEKYRTQVSNQMAIGMDMGYREKSFVVIATKQSGGVVKVIDIKSINGQQVEQMAKDLENKYGYKPIKDLPRMKF